MNSAQNLLINRSRSPKCSYIQPSGYPKGLSGSDTDVSTSNESLTVEEKRVLQKGIRQEPQGEETIADDTDTISSNTLIIHDKVNTDQNSPFYGQIYHQPTKSIDKVGDQNPPFYGQIYHQPTKSIDKVITDQNSPFYGQSYHQPTKSIDKVNDQNPPFYGQNYHQPTKSIDKVNDQNPPFYGQNYHQPTKSIDKSLLQAYEAETIEKYKRLYSDNEALHHLTPRNSTPVSHLPQSPVRSPMYSALQKPPMHSNWEPQYSPTGTNYLPTGEYNQTVYPNQSAYMPFADPRSVQGITDIPKDYLDQSEVLKYLAKELNHQNLLTEFNNYRPSEYSPQPEDHRQVILGNARRRGYGMLNARSKSADRLTVTRSHPDLSRSKHYHSEDNSAKLSHEIQRPETPNRPTYGAEPSQQANQVIELLTVENNALKAELDLYYNKVSKLQKFEMEITKVHKAYEELVRSCDKRERIEKSMRSRLEVEIKRLQDHNKELREHLESAGSHFSKSQFSEGTDSDLRKELSKREVLISQLLTQTKELLAEKERQEIELQAQRATLQEQRNHIDILDNALTNAQANVVRLEDESRKKQVYVERVSQLQKALTNLQQSSEKRLQVERKLRAQHEKEVQALRSQNQGKSPAVSKTDNSENIETLKKTVMEYEEKIIGLEAEVSKWEQRYIAESTMRQIAVDAASVPKDAKIAALERTSQESEKLIAQARTEKLKHMDELYAANRKTTELESRIKDFESKLAEKDAMIKVLQQHSQDKDTVFQNCVLGRPPRHTRAASTVGITTSTSHTTTTTGCSSLGRVSPSPTSTLHRRTGSASGSLLSIGSDSSGTALSSSPSSPVADSAATAAKKSLDEQLKELDSRLSSKDSIISALRAEKERYPSHFWRV